MYFVWVGYVELVEYWYVNVGCIKDNEEIV